MKLRKQTPAKALILAATAGLAAVFFGLVRSDPRPQAGQPAPSRPAVDYGSFFAPNAAPGAEEPLSTPQPHTRTRAS